MATSGGPNVNRDGLVLFLDTPTNRSFRGENTENLVPSGQRTCSSNFSRRGYHVEVWSYALVTDVFGRANATKISITPTGNNNQPYADWGFTAHKSGGSQIGDVYTVSFDYKVTKNTTVPSLAVVYANGYKSPTSANAATFSNETHTPLKDGWTRFSETATITTAGNTWWRFGMSSNNNETEVYVDNFQLELKSKTTPFVDGTRGTTVATGGGWQDMSGNNNHGELVNGVTTDSDGTLQHSLDFDGTNDYIDLGTQFNSLTTFAVEGVFKTDVSSGTDSYQNIWGAGTINSTADYTGISIGNFTGGYTDESFHVSINDTTYQAFVRNGAGFYFDGKYHHFVVNIEPGNNTIYIDGKQQSITYRYGNINTDTGGLNGITNNNTYIGKRSYTGSAGHFNGKIPLIRMYDRGLTQQEVLENYKAIKSRYGL